MPSPPPLLPTPLRPSHSPSIDSQLQSIFFRLAPELRQAIFTHLWGHGFHISTFNERAQLSPCLGSDDESERDPAVLGYRWVDHKWARRLSSFWGGHWFCEELVLDNGKLNGECVWAAVPTMLLVCKKM